ncbi:MAG: hypothetical protein HYT80_09880 [Euryarchaeota archaeon]|nr:hypothetical protein [Euryarchaeota archaeon]
MAGPLEVLAHLRKAYGELEWWPVDAEYHRLNATDPRFEVIVGAILTQNTTWTSVETALGNLKVRKLLSAKALAKADLPTIREAVRPAGFYNQKAGYVQGIAKYLWTTFEGDLDRFFREKTPRLRELLLSFTGIGEETADDILVYAARRPVFIVDAYTRRLTMRLGWGKGTESYAELQRMWAKRLGEEPKAFALAHALVVEHAKRRCTAKSPLCPGCPLEAVCKRVGVEATVYLRAAESGNVAKPPR